ncbi:unnamed protein product [Protopolystoma xenopodis]|uniref:Uncharacterized protein n=1 Tax=Protopolystoma xenopodis TaxID=117903 RepID=A0A3S5CS75_9PLAT|nr:unnamed protein product [Protopolystoma xenopodis]
MGCQKETEPAFTPTERGGAADCANMDAQSDEARRKRRESIIACQPFTRRALVRSRFNLASRFSDPGGDLVRNWYARTGAM